jgi:long-subunit acyl-CoA synthetase (AMP-forming)
MVKVRVLLNGIEFSAVSVVKDVLPSNCNVFKFCGADQKKDLTIPTEGFELLNTKLEAAANTPIDSIPPPNYKDELLYIYTSGTTGLPKAAVLRNSR